MCGICGCAWLSSRRRPSREVLDRATDALTTRGPDDRGTATVPIDPNVSIEERGVAFGHRRLAVVDLSPAGRQPFTSRDGSVLLTFNGEIYNYVELREELRRRGRVFTTETDVEVLLACYEEYGLDCLVKFDGMFAFAIWDAGARRLVLARDRIGKKPLFYRVESDRILFASELKSLLQFEEVPRELDYVALRQYLTYQYVPYPRSIYRGIKKLPPSSALIWRPDEEPTIQRYWRAEEVANFSESRRGDPERFAALRETGALDAARIDPSRPSVDPTNLTFDETLAELRARLEDAVRVRMRCDAPFGAFLSGGIDSTIVVGLMRRFSEKKVRTFSIGFAQKEYDETPFARRTAERFGTDHTEFFVEPNAREIIPELVRYYDEPFADSSAIPTWYLCRTTREEVTVALGGDGGDELFAGYDRYKAVRLSGTIDRAPSWARRALAGPIRALVPNSVRQRSPLRRARRFLETVGMSELERYLQWIAIFNRSRLHSLLSEEYWARAREQEREELGDLTSFARGVVDGKPSAEELDSLDFLKSAYDAFASRDATSAISFTDVLTYLPCDIMTKVDMASMRWSLETRSPFLDANVVELALSTPLAYKMRGRVGKYALRAAFRDLLPEEIDARPKTGFGVPLDAWFRGELNGMLREALLSEGSERAPLFDRRYVESLVREHEERSFDHAARLWALLAFRIWEENQRAV